MERSSFYDRKKEAIMLFGLSLWGSSLPKLKNYLIDMKGECDEWYCS